jgi:hypothetical protein
VFFTYPILNTDFNSGYYLLRKSMKKVKNYGLIYKMNIAFTELGNDLVKDTTSTLIR